MRSGTGATAGASGTEPQPSPAGPDPGPLAEVLVVGVADRVGAVGRSGLGENPVDVALDGLRAEVELGRDTGVRHATGDHAEDLGLALGQPVRQLLANPRPSRFLLPGRRGGEQRGADGGVDERTAVGR